MHPRLDVTKLLASLTPEAWEAAKRQVQANVATPPVVAVPMKRSAPPTRDDGPKKRRVGPSTGSGHAVAAASAQMYGTGQIHGSEEASATTTPHTRVRAEAHKTAAAVKAKPRAVRSLLWRHLLPSAFDEDPGRAHPSMFPTTPVCTSRPASKEVRVAVCRLCIFAENR
jgi:hypothetical protein